MAKAIRFTKDEREHLRFLMLLSANSKLHDSILKKLHESEAVSLAIPVTDAVAEFRAVLGKRLIEPPSGARGVYAQISKRLGALGLTVAQCREIAEAARDRWTGPVRVESLVRQADRLLAPEYGESSRQPGFSRPVEME